MKKHFFYAAMALAMMSSCSNDNDPISAPEGGNQPNPDMVPISLGIGIQNASVDVSPLSRGTGIVGGTTEETNKWNGQELGIIMVEQGTFKQAKIFDNNEQFYAPKGGEHATASGLVTFNTNQIYYYPLQGQFDFFGYHVDGTETKLVTTPEQPSEEQEITGMKVTSKIDGTNDVMAATADLTENQKTEGSEEGKLATADQWRAYGAWAARRGVQPTLTFKHMLSRLTFNVKAGQNSAATDNYAEQQDKLPEHYFPATIENLETLKPGDVLTVDGGSSDGGGTAMTDGAVYVHSIKILNQKSNIEVTFNKSEITNVSEGTKTVTRKQPTLAFTDESGASIFTLKQKPEAQAEDQNLVDLAPVAPKEKTDDAQDGQQATAVGDGIIMEGGQDKVTAEIVLMQYVKVKEATTEPQADAEYKWKVAKMQFDVKAPESNNGDAPYSFRVGNSYKITVKVYGFQKIEITAALEKWNEVDGGEITPEDM